MLDGPIATRPGQITQIDICDMPVVSILGSKKLLSAVDNYSSDFVFYPMRAKSDSPAAVNQYYLDSKSDGVDIDKGGTLYSDNEIVLNSIAMDDVAAEHNNNRGNSNEYEPWGNATVESTFRIGPAEMRKMHVRSGVPEEFWDFSAIAAEKLLAITRNKDGKSPRELRTGRRQSVKKLRVWGCRVIARMPVPWRTGKIGAQAVVGINLGRARTKPGYWVWSPEYGLMTSSNVTFYEDVFPFKTGEFTFDTDTGAKQPPTGGSGYAVMSTVPVGDDGDDGDDGDNGGDDDGGDDDDDSVTPLSSPTNGSDNDDDDDGDGDVMLVADERGTVTEVRRSTLTCPTQCMVMVMQQRATTPT